MKRTLAKKAKMPMKHSFGPQIYRYSVILLPESTLYKKNHLVLHYNGEEGGKNKA